MAATVLLVVTLSCQTSSNGILRLVQGCLEEPETPHWPRASAALRLHTP